MNVAPTDRLSPAARTQIGRVIRLAMFAFISHLLFKQVIDNATLMGTAFVAMETVYRSLQPATSDKYLKPAEAVRMNLSSKQLEQIEL